MQKGVIPTIGLSESLSCNTIFKQQDSFSLKMTLPAQATKRTSVITFKLKAKQSQSCKGTSRIGMLSPHGIKFQVILDSTWR
jgi:hypothetical protein